MRLLPLHLFLLVLLLGCPAAATEEGGEPVGSTDPHVQALPIHHAFLSRGIPLYEQLFNVDQTLGHERMYFVGVPLNIKDGDGMIVRPVVFVY